MKFPVKNFRCYPLQALLSVERHPQEERALGVGVIRVSFQRTELGLGLIQWGAACGPGQGGVGKAGRGGSSWSQ